MLMAGGELSFRICPVCESCAASITIRQRIGRRIMRKKACFIELLSIGLRTNANTGIQRAKEEFCCLKHIQYHRLQ